MKIYYILLFQLISLSLIAKNDFYKCRIFFATTNIVEGYATLPTNKSVENKIRYKKNYDKKDVTKINADKIERIIYYFDHKTPTIFYNTRFNKTMLDDKAQVQTKVFRPYWILQAYTSERLFVYYLSEDYRMNKQRRLVCYSDSNKVLGDYETIILVKKPQEELPTMFSFHSTGYVTNGDKFFKRIALAYFKKNKKILERIKNNEFSLENYDALIRAYCDCDFKDSFYIRY